MRIVNLTFTKGYKTRYCDVEGVLQDENLAYYLTISRLLEKKQPLLDGTHPFYLYEILGWVMSMGEHFMSERREKLSLFSKSTRR